MNKIDFNLATTLFYESLLEHQEHFNFLIYKDQSSDTTQPFTSEDIKVLTEGLLNLSGIAFDVVEVKDAEKQKVSNVNFIDISITCLGRVWEIPNLSYDTAKVRFDDYLLIGAINDILHTSKHPKRFFNVENLFINKEDGKRYSFSANLVWSDQELMRDLIIQLNDHDHAKDLLNSNNELYINTFLTIFINTNIKNDQIFFRFSPVVIHSDPQEGNITSEIFTLDFIHESLYKIGVKVFRLSVGGEQNYDFICEVFSKYLNCKVLNISQDSESFIITFKDREPLTVPVYAVHSDYKSPNTVGVVKALNSLLRDYQSPKRIYFYSNDYSLQDASKSYFICDIKVGQQIFQIVKNHDGFINSHYYRLDFYLLYNEQEESVGITNESKKKILGVDIPHGENWENLFTLFLTLDSHKKMPNSKWYKSLDELISSIGEEEYSKNITKWLQKLLEKTHQEVSDFRPERAKEEGWVILANPIKESLKEVSSPEWVKKVYGEDYNYSSKNPIYTRNGFYFYYTLGGRILRGIIHSGAVVKSETLLAFIDNFALKNPDECADVIHVYSKLPFSISVPRLTQLRAKIKKRNIQTRIETALRKIGTELNLTPDQVEEISIPNYGLNENHEYICPIGDFKAKFKILSHNNTSLNWINEKDKVQTSTPISLKKEYAQELKEYRARIKFLKTQLSIQKGRIEEMYLKNRAWTFKEWLPLYITHNFIGVLGKQLIWHFYNDSEKCQGIWKDGQFINVDKKPIKWLNENTKVQLWHPLGFDPDYILSWRNFLQENEITQPFKQAFREIYILTDAELETHS